LHAQKHPSAWERVTRSVPDRVERPERARLSSPERIGLLGGSFDPPHLAHLALARLAREHLALDELRWIPAGQPWQKAHRRLAPAADREAMVRLLLRGEDRFVVDRCEIERAGPTYTVDTVRDIAAAHPDAELFLILGQDQFGRLDTWRDWQALVSDVTLAVAARDGLQPQPPQALRDAPLRLRRLPLPPLPIASSGIRDALAQGHDVTSLVGPDVAGYIATHHLYRKV
jgi:nicotinate-nucleotide adenylyltransferase